MHIREPLVPESFVLRLELLLKILNGINHQVLMNYWHN
jgi:hypothetical protein